MLISHYKMEMEVVSAVSEKNSKQQFQRRTSSLVIKERKAKIEELCNVYPFPLQYEKLRLTVLGIIGIIFICFGIDILVQNGKIVSQGVAYGTDCILESNGVSKTCTIQATIEKDMTAPVYLYYKVDNFWQNHRKFFKSIEVNQFRGEYATTTDCNPVLKGVDNKDLFPCGLQAWSYFNDEIDVQATRDSTTICSDTQSGHGDCSTFTGLALPNDIQRIEHPAGALPSDSTMRTAGTTISDFTFSEKVLLNITSEKLNVWMKQAATSTFYKLYSVINYDLSKDDVLSFSIDVNFPAAASYNNHKFPSVGLHLSTAQKYGGKHIVMGYSYLFFGSAIILTIGAIIAAHMVLSEKYNDNISSLVNIQAAENKKPQEML